MWYLLATLLVTAAPAQDNADDLFQRMDQQLRKAKTLQTQLDITIEGDKGSLSFKGRLAAAEGNKMHLELAGEKDGQPVKQTLIADGAKLHQTGIGPDRAAQEAPRQLTTMTLAALARTGMAPPLVFSRYVSAEGSEKPKDFSVEQDFKVTDVKLGKRETVAGKEAQAIEYKVTLKDIAEPLTVTTWLDVKTQLPLKRVITGTPKEGKIKITESYTGLVVDEKLDAKEFELPK